MNFISWQKMIWRIRLLNFVLLQNHVVVAYVWFQSGRQSATLFQESLFSDSYLKARETPCTIWYHLYNLKNVKNTHGEVLLLKLLKKNSPLCFSCFSNSTDGTKSYKVSEVHISIYKKYLDLLDVTRKCTKSTLRKCRFIIISRSVKNNNAKIIFSLNA